MKINLKYLFIGTWLLLLQHFNVSAQNIPEINTPDPNAASLMVASEIPANHYTGAANITIPLYTISVKNFSMPISLAYQSTGIQVAQEASFIGLGWSLNAGGSISRVIRGWDDFEGDPDNLIYSFLSNPNVIKEPIDATIYDYPFMESETEYAKYFKQQAAENENRLQIPHDMEPDIFSFNFCGYSGKFFFDKTGSGVFVGQDNLKIKKKTQDEFILIDPQGNEYTFLSGTKSRTCSLVYPSRNSLMEDEILGANSPDNYSRYYVSTWNLSQILLPTKQVITFNYINGNPFRSPVRISHNSIFNLPSKALSIPLNNISCNGITPSDTKFTYSFQEYKDEKILSSIVFPGGIVNFLTGNRLDLLGLSAYNQLRIKEIKVNNNEGLIKRIVLNNDSYFKTDSTITPQYLSYRLKLSSINIDDLPPYIFSYSEQYSLPKKNSLAFDHWGYYNGKNSNNDILPSFNSYAANKVSESELMPVSGPEMTSDISNINPIHYIDISFSGADREPSKQHAQTATLTSIKYPTGSIRYFKYGVNTYFSGNFYLPEARDVWISTYNNIAAQETIVYIPTNQTVHLMGAPRNDDYDSQGGSLCNTDYTINPLIFATLKDASGTTKATLASTGFANTSYEKSVILTPGYYSLKVQRDNCSYHNYSVTMGFLNQQYVPALASYGGGLRIEEIEDDATTTKYYYTTETGKTSGLLLSKPEYIVLYYNGECNADGPIDDPKLGSFALVGCRYANSIRNLNGMSGSSVGYSRVCKVLKNGDNDSIVTTYYFKNQPEKYRSYRLPDLPNIDVLTNGLIDSITYQSNTSIVKKETFLYEKDNSRNYIHTACRQDFARNSFLFYRNNNTWWKLTNKDVYDYFSNGEVLKTNENYEYNQINYLQSKKSYSNSLGNKIDLNYFYPTDFISNDTYAKMVARHTVAPVIKESKYNNSQLIETSIVNYQLANNIAVPQSVQQTIGTTTTTKLTYNSYDDKGNVTQYTGSDGVVTTIFWGYNKAYPVAKVISGNPHSIPAARRDSVNNIAFRNSDIKAQIDLDIKDLTTALKMYVGDNNYQVTLYTYKPLVGMTSETNANGNTSSGASGLTNYYTYDSFGRLSEVRDDEGKLLKKNSYNYANQ